MSKDIGKSSTSQGSIVLFSSGPPPSPPVDLQDLPGSTTEPHLLTIEQHPGGSTESSNVGLITDLQKLSTSDAVARSREQYSLQQPDSNTESIRSPLRLFALIIGINEYKWVRKLSGAVPDAVAVRNYLQKHLRIPNSQIKMLLDSQATRAAIIRAIQALSLDINIKKGDPILIYFAGHGSWAYAPLEKGWKVGGTGKIEFLIPYDHSSLQPVEDGDRKYGIPDRTLGALLWQLAIEKGDNITVILDSCHSGSGTRNHGMVPEFVRGIDVKHIQVPSGLDENIWSVSESSRGSEPGRESQDSSSDSKRSERSAVVHSGSAFMGLRSHVLLAACHSEEFAEELMNRGVFTKALFETLENVGIDNLTYAALIARMPDLSSEQNPQCEGVNQNRVIFNAKATSKPTVYYKIREKKVEYVMPNVGFACGISLGAEFKVYQDHDSGILLGVVVARELSAFSTTLYAKEPRFVLKGNGVALQIGAGTEEHVLRIYVADERLKALVNKIERADPSQKTIQLVEQDQAEFGMSLEGGNVVFDIFDPLVTKYGLTRMPFALENTPQAISPVLRAAHRFYLHLRRTPKLNDTKKHLADYVEIEMAEMKHDEDDFEAPFSPIEASWKRGKVFDLQVNNSETFYGWKIINKSKVNLYPALYYFDVSDWSITPYYVPPIARGTDDHPLKGRDSLPVGYGDSGWVPHKFCLREKQNVDVGILKLFLWEKRVDTSDVAQLSPFDSGRSLSPISKAPIRKSVPWEAPKEHWDTILVPVVQRRVDKHPSQQNSFTTSCFC